MPDTFRNEEAAADRSPTGTTGLARRWGTAHLVAAGLFTAALVCCLARPPGHTYDLHPLPVPAWGWVMWGCGILYLASTTTVHALLGTALRRTNAVGAGPARAGVVANAALVVVAGRSMLLAADSQTHAYGLEGLNATVLASAVLSALLLLGSFRGRSRAGDGGEPRRLFRWQLPLVMQIVAVILTAASLLLVETVPRSRPTTPSRTTGGRSDESTSVDLAALVGRVGDSRRVLDFQRS